MITQLEDISNKVAQTKISSDRLRNEEIRRRMADPWAGGTNANPVLHKTKVNPSTPFMPPTISPESESEQDSTDNGYDGRTGVSDFSSAVTGALPGLGSMAASHAGLGAMSPAVGGAISGALGDWGGAIKGGATGLAASLGAGRHAGLIGTLAKDIFNDVPAVDMFGNLS